MIIYVDVLLFINFVVDFFIIRISSYVNRAHLSIKRCLLCAGISAVFSLYIFLPDMNMLAEVLLRLLPAAVVTLAGYSYKNVRLFLRSFFTFYSVSFIYAGFMMGIWMLFSPDKLAIKNGVVYIDISPLLLITLSFIIYVVISIAARFTKRSAETASRVKLSLSFFGSSALVTALVDTGHSLTDMFTNNDVIIIDKNVSSELFGAEETLLMLSYKTPQNANILTRYRLIAVETVAGEKLLPAVKIDNIRITDDKTKREITEPIAVISDTALSDDYSAIISPELLS